MVVIATIVFEIGETLIYYIVMREFIDILPFIEILLIECLYNAILTITLYPLIQKSGYKIETEYKGNKILTRYF